VAQTEKKSVKVNDPFLRYLPSYPGDLNFWAMHIIGSWAISGEQHQGSEGNRLQA
jgi:hypothetical protein